MTLGKLFKKFKLMKAFKFGFIFLSANVFIFVWLFIEMTHKDLCQMNISWFKKYLIKFR